MSKKSNTAVSDTEANPIVEELTGEIPIVEWLLPDILPRGSLLCIAGMPGAGKSFLCHVLSFAMATGISVLGKTPPAPIRVLYFDNENARPDSIQYKRWAWAGLGHPDLDLIAQNLWFEPFTLGTSDWADTAQSAIADHEPDWIVFDTATPCFDIQDENDNGYAGIVIRQIRELMSWANGAGVMVIKHARRLHRETTEDEEEERYTLRGAKAWEGSVDGFIFHTRSAGKPRSDGLAATYLVPGKTRAFGLKTRMRINPRWVQNRAGIYLSASSSDLLLEE